MKTRKVSDDAGRMRRVHGVRSKCGKLVYSSKKFAKGIARIQSLETGELLLAYKCPHQCHGWHVGHPPMSRPNVDAWGDVAS